MNGAKLRARLQAGEPITMFTPHHASSGLSARLVKLGADSIFVDCEHGTWSFEDVRATSQIVRAAGGAAIVRPHSHERPVLIALAEAFQRHGGTFIAGEATGLETIETGIQVWVAGGLIKADHVVVAAGAWSRALAEEVGDRPLLDTERGYHVLFPSAGALLTRPVCYPEQGFYMTPMADGLRAAGTVELGGLKAPLNPGRTARIRQGVKTLLPDAGEATREWLGFRPSMPDSLPVIGNSPTSPRVTYAFGHGHLGLTLAGITGRLVADLVACQQPILDVASLRPHRFGRSGRRLA